MTTKQKKAKLQKRVMPIPARKQGFKEAMNATNKPFAETLARLAK